MLRGRCRGGDGEREEAREGPGRSGERSVGGREEARALPLLGRAEGEGERAKEGAGWSGGIVG